MILQELIDELRENILHDRSDRTTGDSDLMWTDNTLARYINEAQTRFARKTYVLRDGFTPEVTRVTIREGVEDYPLHESVLAVISAQIDGDRMALARTGFSVLAAPLEPITTHYFDPAQAQTLLPGRPVAFSTDEAFAEGDNGELSRVSMRLYPVPDAAAAGQVIRLRVVRTPIERLTTRDMNARPEIPEIYHLDMLDWSAYLALRVADLDAGLPQRALEFRASFEQHVSEVRREIIRKRFAPVTWGFGRNGYSWER